MARPPVARVPAAAGTPRIRHRERFRAVSPVAAAVSDGLEDRLAADAVRMNPGPDALDREIDEATAQNRPLDFETVHEEFAQGGVRLRPEEQVTLGAEHPGGPGAGLPIADRPQSIQDRLRAVSTLPDNYATWYRRLTVKRMAFRGIALDKIAQHANVSVRTIERDLKKINDQLAIQLLDKPVENYVGESVMFYGEVRGMALQIATNAQNTASARLGGLETALKAQKATEGLLEVVGYLKSTPVLPRKSERDKNVSQTDLMHQLISSFVGTDDKAIEAMVSDAPGESDIIPLL